MWNTMYGYHFIFGDDELPVPRPGDDAPVANMVVQFLKMEAIERLFAVWYRWNAEQHEFVSIKVYHIGVGACDDGLHRGALESMVCLGKITSGITVEFMDWRDAFMWITGMEYQRMLAMTTMPPADFDIVAIVERLIDPQFFLSFFVPWQHTLCIAATLEATDRFLKVAVLPPCAQPSNLEAIRDAAAADGAKKVIYITTADGSPIPQFHVIEVATGIISAASQNCGKDGELHVAPVAQGASPFIHAHHFALAVCVGLPISALTDGTHEEVLAQIQPLYPMRLHSFSNTRAPSST